MRNDDQVLVVGITEQGEQAFEVVLRHGADPDVLAFDCGYVVVTPLDANRTSSGELILRLAGASGHRRATSRRNADKLGTPVSC